MQVAAEPATLLLPRGDGGLPRLLEVGREGPGAQSLREQRGRQPEHVLVAAAEGEVPRTQPHDELGAGAVQREGPGVGRRTSRRRRGRPSGVRSAAYGSTSASRITRSARTGSSPTWPATRLAASSGSRRPPKSASSTVPRSSTWSGWNPIAASPATRPSAPTEGSVTPAMSSSETAATNTVVTAMTQTVTTTTETVTPRTSTISGSATPTTSAGPTRARTRKAYGSPGPFSMENSANPASNPHEPAASAIHCSARRSSCSLVSIRHQMCARSPQPPRIARVAAPSVPPHQSTAASSGPSTPTSQAISSRRRHRSRG